MRISDWSSDVCSSDRYAFSQIAVEVLARFREQHPTVRVRCIIDSSETLEGMLKSHYIDAAVLTMLEDDAEIETRVLANDNRFLLGPKDSDLKDLDHVPMTELAHRPIIRQHNATVSLKRMRQKLSRDRKSAIKGKRVSVRVDHS